MDFGELGKLVKERRSIRKFLDKPVPDDLLLKALELAGWAPSGGNYQPWKFLIISNRDLITRMADAVRGKMECMLSWPEAKKFGDTVDRWSRNCDLFRTAPVCIAVLMGRYRSVADQIMEARGEKDPVAREIHANRQIADSTLQSVAAAIMTLLLALNVLGLGALWMAGPLISKREIEEILQASGDWDFVALIPVGYPAESPTPRPRKTLSEITAFLR